jgi:hypothetical protein
METGYRGAVATLVVLADNTTSLYLSNGGGFIGMGAHQAVKEASEIFLAAAGGSLAKMKQTDTFPLPALGRVRFYVLTGTGGWTAEAAQDDLGHNRHDLSGVFHVAHAVIAAIREQSEKQR